MRMVTPMLHQSSLTKRILTDRGFDPCSKGIKTVQMAHPTASDVPPDPKLLKTLQAHAGEFNWLATYTRPDLAYYTSLIASTASQHGEWTLQLCKKVLRYLIATCDQGILLRRGACPTLNKDQNVGQKLFVWTDAGFGGVGTRAQTGILIAWDGAVILARSSRQSTPALSTCESEVSAAATGYTVCEGLMCLLREWDLKLSPPALLIDNRSALTVAEHGGTWRTRYFAVRASRLTYEHQLGNLELLYAPTAAMLADGLTKLASGEVLEKLRRAMDGDMADSITEARAVTTTDPGWLGETLRTCLARVVMRMLKGTRIPPHSAAPAAAMEAGRSPKEALTAKSSPTSPQNLTSPTPPPSSKRASRLLSLQGFRTGIRAGTGGVGWTGVG